MNATQVAWVSSHPFGRFHIETDASAANNEGDFESICGITGTVLFQRGAKRVPEEIRCSQCFQLSSVTGIDVAARNDGLSCPTVTHGATGGEAPAIASPLQVLRVAQRQEQPTKAVNHEAGERNPDLMRPSTSISDTSNNNTENSTLVMRTAHANTGAADYTSFDAAPEIFKSFSCVRRGIDGFISAVDWIVDRETAAAEMEHA